MKDLYRILKVKSPDGRSFRLRAYFQIKRQMYERGKWEIERTTIVEHSDGSAMDIITWSLRKVA